MKIYRAQIVDKSFATSNILMFCINCYKKSYAMDADHTLKKYRRSVKKGISRYFAKTSQAKITLSDSLNMNSY